MDTLKYCLSLYTMFFFTEYDTKINPPWNGFPVPSQCYGGWNTVMAAARSSDVTESMKKSFTDVGRSIAESDGRLYRDNSSGSCSRSHQFHYGTPPRGRPQSTVKGILPTIRAVDNVIPGLWSELTSPLINPMDVEVGEESPLARARKRRLMQNTCVTRLTPEPSARSRRLSFTSNLLGTGSQSSESPFRRELRVRHRRTKRRALNDSSHLRRESGSTERRRVLGKQPELFNFRMAASQLLALPLRETSHCTPIFSSDRSDAAEIPISGPVTTDLLTDSLSSQLFLENDAWHANMDLL